MKQFKINFKGLLLSIFDSKLLKYFLIIFFISALFLIYFSCIDFVYAEECANIYLKDNETENLKNNNPKALERSNEEKMTSAFVIVLVAIISVVFFGSEREVAVLHGMVVNAIFEDSWEKPDETKLPNEVAKKVSNNNNKPMICPVKFDD